MPNLEGERIRNGKETVSLRVDGRCSSEYVPLLPILPDIGPALHRPFAQPGVIMPC